MNGKCIIDIYAGGEYDPRRHIAREVYWSDGRLCYWGWLYGTDGRIVGDYTASAMQDIEKALGAKFKEVQHGRV